MTDSFASGLFDANAWMGCWPFGSGEAFPLDSVIAGLRDAGIRGALVSPLRAVLAAEPSSANAELIAAAARATADRSDPGFDLRLAPVIDPSQADWEDQLTQLIETAANALGAIRIIPNYHGYHLDDAHVDALAQALTTANIPLIVQVRILDERAQHPRMVVTPVPVAAIADLSHRHPTLGIVAASLFFNELDALRDSPAVHIELSSLESADTLPDVLATIPSARVLLGTHAPLYVAEAALAKLRGDGISPETLAAIGGDTARARFTRTPQTTAS